MLTGKEIPPTTSMCYLLGKKQEVHLRRSYSAASSEEVADTLRLVRVLQAFRSRGHLAADLDPLKRQAGPWLKEGVHIPEYRWSDC